MNTGAGPGAHRSRAPVRIPHATCALLGGRARRSARPAAGRNPKGGPRRVAPLAGADHPDVAGPQALPQRLEHRARGEPGPVVIGAPSPPDYGSILDVTP